MCSFYCIIYVYASKYADYRNKKNYILWKYYKKKRKNLYTLKQNRIVYNTKKLFMSKIFSYYYNNKK